MVILLALTALFAPRLALFLVWVFTPIVTRSFGTFIVPLLGLMFLPFTTLVYSLAYVPAIGAPTGIGWLWVALAFFADMAYYGGASYKSRGQTDASADMEAQTRRAA